MYSMMETLQRKAMELSSPESPFSIQEAAEADRLDPAIERCIAVTNYLAKGFIDNPETSKKAKFFMTKIIQEAIEELKEAPPELVARHFAQSAAAFYWVATGQVIENLPLPDDFFDNVGMLPGDSVPMGIEGAEKAA